MSVEAKLAPGPSLGSELRISPRLVAVLFVVLGLVLVYASDECVDDRMRMNVELLASLCYVLAALTLWLDHWRPTLGRWFIAVALFGLIHLGTIWLQVPGFLTLLVIPVFFAVLLVHLPAAFILAAVETALIVALPATVAPAAERGTVAVTLIAIWATVGLLAVVYRTVHQLSRWVWTYFQSAQTLLEEARDRKAELEEALEGLAHANRQLALAGVVRVKLSR